MNDFPIQQPRLSRRQFLAVGAAAAGALTVGFDATGALAKGEAVDLIANPFVTLHPDGSVTVVAKHFEMGQGTTTGLATLAAEELDADWDKVTVVYAPADNARYKNLAFGVQGTGGSTAIANAYMQYRQAGAAARAMLVAAAAEAWGVAPERVTVAKGVISSGDRSAGFGEFAAAAAERTPPTEPALKDPADFTLIGDPALRRKDGPAKTDGSAIFAIDIRRDGQVRAVLARPPKFGGKLESFDPAPAKAVRGVLEVVETPRGVAVVAETTYAAIKGRRALIDAEALVWDDFEAETRSTDAILAEHRDALERPGATARDDGDVEAGLKGAATLLEAAFSFPYLAHAPMEPLNCVIAFDGESATMWDGCQFPAIAVPTLANVLGIPPEKVRIETVLAGGSFGRRATPTSDYHVEAALVVKALQGGPLAGRPVQLVWTREDDLSGGYYRALFAEKVRVGLDESGAPVAYEHRLAGKPILIGTPFEASMAQGGVDASSVEGASTLPYAIPNLKVDVRNTETPIPALWWRSVGHSHTGYSTEVMLDMMAAAAGVDPVEYRLKLLDAHPRHAGVLRLAAEKSGWGAPLGAGRGRGVAVHESFNSFVATVAEVSVVDEAIKIDRMVVAIDCGLIVNPDVVIAQLEGGTGFAIGAAMRNEITLTDGVVDQANFPDYEPLRIADMPKIEAHIVPSSEAPTGVGEPGVPPAAPALANAIFAATGVRIFDLPMTRAGISFV